MRATRSTFSETSADSGVPVPCFRVSVRRAIPSLAARSEVEEAELSAHLPAFGRQLGCVRQFGPCTTTIGEKSVKAKTRTKGKRPLSFAAGVGHALRRAAKDARKTARMYGTPLYVWENGKVVAKKP